MSQIDFSPEELKELEEIRNKAKQKKIKRWNCACGNAVNMLAIRWQENVHRPVAHDVKIGCTICTGKQIAYDKERYQKLEIKLTAKNKSRLVPQIIAQVIDNLPGYLPKSDIKKALTFIEKG